MAVTDEFDELVFEPSTEFADATNVRAFMDEYGIADYDELIARTCGDIEGVEASGIEWFWDELVDYLDIEFFTEYDAVRDDSAGPQFTQWYPGGELNLAHNVLDRHAADPSTRDDVACLWEGEDGAVREVTFADLHEEANRVANALIERDIGEGDTVGLYMPMVPEVLSILYGCFKVGAIAVPIFSGFGVDATATRLADAGCTILFTADGFYRRGEEIHLKDAADAACSMAASDGDGGDDSDDGDDGDDANEGGHTVEHVVVYDRFGAGESEDHETDLPWNDARDEHWAEAVGEQSAEFETRSLNASVESMLLYSSGTTGKPKGIVHTHAGLQVQCAKEIYFGFDHKPDDRFFWVSDIGWMMGPWSLIGNHTFGGTVFMYEGAPDHPEPDRFWRMIEDHDLTAFGISPTAIRALRKQGEEYVEGHDLSSLRVLGSTGEPWDPESWLWFHEHVGSGKIPIINISGGTEICGCFLMPMPIQSLKPCTLGGPGLGMDIDIVNAAGESVADEGERGYLVARDSCPSMTKSLWSGDERYLEEYWSTFEDPPLWNHGDWAQKDEGGLWFLHGRADDALNVAGRKVGPAEVEAALLDHDAVNQAAAVGVPDDTTGTAVVTYAVLEDGVEGSDDLRGMLRARVGEELGKPFRPREVLFVDALPKTQSGKIVRRVVASIYRGEELGDTGSIENPDALQAIAAAK